MSVCLSLSLSLSVCVCVCVCADGKWINTQNTAPLELLVCFRVGHEVHKQPPKVDGRFADSLLGGKLRRVSKNGHDEADHLASRFCLALVRRIKDDLGVALNIVVDLY